MPTDWLSAPDYSISRLLIGRGLAAIYLIAFLVAVRQFRPLLGERGLLPAPRFLARGPVPRGAEPLPLALLGPAAARGRLDGLRAVGGCVLLAGCRRRSRCRSPMLAWLVLWVLYLSIVNVGQTFYGFGWESLLLEAGFLAIFLGNARSRRRSRCSCCSAGSRSASSSAPG